MVQGTHIYLKEIFPEYISPDLLNHENAFFFQNIGQGNITLNFNKKLENRENSWSQGIEIAWVF